MPAWCGERSNASGKKGEHQCFSEDWKRNEKSSSPRDRELAKNRGTETGFSSGLDSDGVLGKRGHPLPRPTHHGTVSSSVSCVSSSGSPNGQQDYGFIGPYRSSDPMTLTRGSINSGSRIQQQGENKHLFKSDLLPDTSASPRSEHGHLHGEATPPTISDFCSPRESPEVKLNPRSRSPMCAPISKGQTNQTLPFIPRACGSSPESLKERQEDRKNLGHPLPLPFPPSPPSSPLHILTNNAANGSFQSLHARWKKGKLLGRGTFGHVHLGFDSKNGGMCAIKEVRVISDDENSHECLRQLNKEISLLNRLRHPNIVLYYGSELNDSSLSVYLEYVPGGSIHKLLQEYGPFKEPVIQIYTRQILSGLAYLHSRKTVHRDIKGANILVGPNGDIKLADFGLAKHITQSSSVLSFKGSPYWMAPEVIMNCKGYHLAVDIWSLGCTIIEMATSKPPWSQFEGVAAIFKIGNTKEIPQIPDHLSDDGKDFLKLCLQRDPSARPTAARLLEHRFVRDQATVQIAKININRDIMQPNSDISYMPRRGEEEVHASRQGACWRPLTKWSLD